MKIFATAFALVIAAPAAAQPAPAPQHQGHDQHQQHQQQNGQSHDQHGQMPGHAEEGNCCADRNGNGRMDCCEHMAQAGDRRGCCQEQSAQPSAEPQVHQGH
jgi:hypothetical protein